MGTNYYLHSTDAPWVEKHFVTYYPHYGDYADLRRVYESERDSPIDTAPLFRKKYKVHLHKQSCGWQPALQWYPNAYLSFKEMTKFLIEYQDKFTIFNEYGEKAPVAEYVTNIKRAHDWPDALNHQSTDSYRVYVDSEGYNFLAYNFA